MCYSVEIELTGGVEIVGFADDVFHSGMLTAETIDIIETWMNSIKLQLAHHKTEVAMVSMPNVGVAINGKRRLLAGHHPC